jgi:hypothetical protein
MVCYIVPVAGSIAHFFARKKIPSWKHSQKQRTLTNLLLGGAIFGVVDHLWNGELFLIGPNIAKDLMLGVTITVTIVGVWLVISHFETAKATSKAVN